MPSPEDFPYIDIHALTPRQRDAVIQAGIHRGLTERSEMARRIWRWTANRIARVFTAVAWPRPERFSYLKEE